ncbi:glycoside hydrolase superfamily [Fennellomyces sp. T-0311]|nr:glycoside hydrolase superfamily [Fennellomyces sp. T-0311]
MLLSSLSAAFSVLLSCSLVQAAPTSGILSWDEAYAKAEALVSQMSLEQKVNITTGTKWRRTKCVGNTYAVEGGPEFPSLCLQDGPLGIRFADNVTAGVAGITAASSWDKKAIRDRGMYMGKEFRNKGIHVQLGPSVDLLRGPHAGRIWEGFGEDPYLQGVAGAETVLGIQGEGVVATAKHYIFNNQETKRKASTSTVDERTFHEIYLWPYARMIEAGVGAVMCSYNMIDGIWACESDYVMNQVLKGELGFKGYVMSDWGATHSTVPAVNAGLDMTMPGDIIMGDNYTYFGANLTKAVHDGEVTEERVHDMAVRIVSTYYKMGQDKDFPETTVNMVNRTEAPYVNVQEDHHKYVRSMGGAATVLLKNDGILPLSADSIDTLALIGSDASDDPNGPNSCVSRGCSNGTLAMAWGSGTADFPYLITPHQGIQDRVGDEVDIITEFWDWDTAAAAEVAKQADIALVFSNADSGEEHIIVDGNVGDRNNLSLWHNGDALIQAVAEVHENVVVVIHSVGPVLMDKWIDNENVKAVVWSGVPGQESGNSLADVLFGDVNPSGRLPYTIARHEADYNVQIIVYSEKLEVGYKHFDANNIEPLFEFGFGLSYTKFEYGKIKLNTKRSKGALVSASISVQNVGDVDGAEVPQAYISFPESAGEPPKHLRGFEKVYLKAGQKRNVKFEFGETELTIWDDKSHEWVLVDGEYTLHIGASSRDIRDSVTFTLQ